MVMGELEFALFDDCGLARKFDVVVCCNCSFAFYDTPDTAEDFALFYRDQYFSASYTSSSQATEDVVIEAENDPLAIIGTYLRPETKICEIGCGRGAILAKLKDAGYTNLYGVEPAPGCVQFVREHYGIEVLAGTAACIPFDTKFDMIISTHVLEHLVNLQEAVGSISCQLTDDGVVYIEVPDLEGYDSQQEVSPWDYITFYEHINHFTVLSLRGLFKQHRLSMIDWGRKTLAEGSRLPLPALYGVFRKNGSEECVSMPTKPFDINRVYHWLNTCRYHKENELEKLAGSKAPVYIWGINLPIQKMLCMSPLQRCNISGLLDRDPAKQKNTINGMRIQSPEVLKSVAADAVVVIWGGPYRKSIEGDLHRIGFEGRVVVI